MTFTPSDRTAENPAAAEHLQQPASEILRNANREAGEKSLGFAGSVSPEEAWELFTNGDAHLVDVRTAEERKFVGHVSNTLHIAWQIGPALIKNPRFLRELENKIPKKNSVILFLCRSGKRSAAAAAAATAAGFTQVYNVREGFEGDLDDNQQRGRISGWRQRGLPWVQD
jgi:rhodanese-related sulfurtransferase